MNLWLKWFTLLHESFWTLIIYEHFLKYTLNSQHYHLEVFKIKGLVGGVLLTGYTVAMVTYYVEKIP